MLLDDGVNEYIYGNGRTPIAHITKDDGVVTYLHSDIIGSVMASTDSNGALVANTEYSPYGVNLGLRLSPFGFAGEWTDPDTKHSYLRARWLDTVTGTFLSRDPLVQSTGDAYGYGAGNPISNIDPLGLFPIKDLNTFNEFMLSDTASNINTGLSITATAIAITLLAVPLAPVVGVLATGLTLVAVVSSGYQTYLNCQARKVEDCIWGIAGGILSLVPVVGSVGKGPIVKIFERATKKGPKHAGPSEIDSARRAQRDWDRFQYGTYNSLGTLTDVSNRLRGYQDKRYIKANKKESFKC